MSKRPIQLIGIAFVVAVLLMLGREVLHNFRALGAQQEFLRGLQADDIAYVTLYPNYEPNSLLDDSVNLYDRQAIAEVVNAYKHMRSYRAGDGRLSGRWQLTVAFNTYDHRQITSDIYHTDYADLVFISTSVGRERRGLGDMLASNEISHVILRALARKRTAAPRP